MKRYIFYYLTKIYKDDHCNSIQNQVNIGDTSKYHAKETFWRLFKPEARKFIEIIDIVEAGK